MSEPDSARLRAILTDTFSDEDLTHFCYDHFRRVYEQFASGMTRTSKVHHLIEHCERRGEVPKLLDLLRQERPAALSSSPQPPAPTAGAIYYQHFGDIVGRDKIRGDIHASGISGEANVIGHQGQAQVQGATSGADLAQIFAPIYQQINARPADPNVGKDELTRTVQAIQQEAQQGDQANERKLTRWLGSLAGMADDIFEATVAALTSPQAVVATAARRATEEVKHERREGERYER